MSERKRIVPLVWWWDIGVPSLTWIVLSLFWIVPPSLRILPVVLILTPSLVGSYRTKWWISTMLQVAKTKGFRVQDDAQLPQDKPCILGIHPHGKYPMSIFSSFETRPEIFADFVMAQSSLGKYIPSVGWIAMFFGRAIDATKDSISNAIASGKRVGLMPGGARETQ